MTTKKKLLSLLHQHDQTTAALAENLTGLELSMLKVGSNELSPKDMANIHSLAVWAFGELVLRDIVNDDWEVQ
ncbi:MAG: hypothetical protein OEQ39_27285 [Gammaproteobacteria bacterium]|nr:hypothetical protein [Gammaproteobacteria bacterium]